jgi:hypothetical protein
VDTTTAVAVKARARARVVIDLRINPAPPAPTANDTDITSPNVETSNVVSPLHLLMPRYSTPNPPGSPPPIARLVSLPIESTQHGCNSDVLRNTMITSDTDIKPKRTQSSVTTTTLGCT